MPIQNGCKPDVLRGVIISRLSRLGFTGSLRDYSSRFCEIL